MRPRFSKSSRSSISWRSRSSRILGLSKASSEASGIQPWGRIPAANNSDSSSDKNPLGVLNRSAAKVSQPSSDTAMEVDSGGMMWAQYPASSLCKLPSFRGKSCDSTDAAASSLTKNGLSGNLAMAETKCKRASSGLRCVRRRSQPKRSCFMICSPGLKLVNCINKFFSSSSVAAVNHTERARFLGFMTLRSSGCLLGKWLKWDFGGPDSSTPHRRYQKPPDFSHRFPPGWLPGQHERSLAVLFKLFWYSLTQELGAAIWVFPKIGVPQNHPF